MITETGAIGLSLSYGTSARLDEVGMSKPKPRDCR